MCCCVLLQFCLRYLYVHLWDKMDTMNCVKWINISANIFRHYNFLTATIHAMQIFVVTIIESIKYKWV